MKVYLSPAAFSDMGGAIAFLQKRGQPTAAADLVDRVLYIADQIAAGAFEGPIRMLRSGQVVRTWPVAPYRIYYDKHDDVLEVVRVYHQARRPITK